MTDSCAIFCAIGAGLAPASVVKEWEDAVAFRPLDPVVPGHVLVIAKEHSDNVAANPALAGLAMTRAAELASRLPSANVVTSIGSDATQTVFHSHFHVVPRHAGDEVNLPWACGQTRTANPRPQFESIYAGEDLPTDRPTVFLAGPTPRSPEVSSWRPAAIAHLRGAASVAVAVVVPEPRYGWEGTVPEDQYDWERQAMDAATVIAFWIPRDMQTMPALTTNIEWGRYAASGRVELGLPPEAPDARRNRYIAHDAQRLGLQVHPTLTGLGATVVRRIQHAPLAIAATLNPPRAEGE